MGRRTNNATTSLKTPTGVPISELLADEQRQSAFYRETLEQIAQDTRKTRARRLAESALTFWDTLKKEAHERKLQMRHMRQPSGGSDLSSVVKESNERLAAHRKPIHKAKLRKKANAAVG